MYKWIILLILLLVAIWSFTYVPNEQLIGMLAVKKFVLSNKAPIGKKVVFNSITTANDGEQAVLKP
jgi:hypothetical protein